MLGKTKIREHMGHVTLGLFSSAVLNELSESRKSPDKKPERKKMIEALIDSFEEIINPHSIQGERRENIMFQRPQEAWSLRKTFGLRKYGYSEQNYVGKARELKYILSQIINAETFQEDRKKYLNTATRFLQKLCKNAIIGAETSTYDPRK